jgi:hypothetical protein
VADPNVYKISCNRQHVHNYIARNLSNNDDKEKKKSAYSQANWRQWK